MLLKEVLGILCFSQRRRVPVRKKAGCPGITTDCARAQPSLHSDVVSCPVLLDVAGKKGTGVNKDSRQLQV